MLPKLYTRKEVAAYLEVSMTTLWRLIKSGKIRETKNKRITEKQILIYLGEVEND